MAPKEVTAPSPTSTGTMARKQIRHRHLSPQLFPLLTALLAIHTAQASWVASTQPPTPTTNVGLTFGLTLANVDRLDDHLQTISDPTSSNYGHYVTVDELNRLYPTAHPQAAQHIQEWLQTSSPKAIVDTSVHGFVMASVPVLDLPLLFPNITLLSYEESPPHHKRQRPSVVRATNPVTMPNRIARLIDFMSGLEYLPTHTPSSKLRVDPVASPSSYGVDPPSLRTRYKIGTTVCTHPNTTQATANFLGEGYSEADLAFFFEVFYPSSDGQKVSKVVGPNNGKRYSSHGVRGTGPRLRY
jgi:tripeptidyl-peptidase-1